MLIDGISASHPQNSSTATERAVASFLQFIEKKLGVLIVRDARDSRDDNSLNPGLLFGSKLLKEGVILDFGRSFQYSDEPRFKSWFAMCNTDSKHMVGGTTWDDDIGALFAALAEAQERYIWLTQEDYFVRQTTATVSEIAKKGSFISPAQITGFSDEQRTRPSLTLRHDATYLWIEGQSLVKRARTYIPAQVVSGALQRLGKKAEDEPVIRAPSTIGLATWPDKTGAELAGALEAIERESYIITWLNQLTLPRYSLASLANLEPAIEKLFSQCERYLLKPHIIPLVTDAPTHSIMVVLEDMSGHAPRFSVGLKAHRSIKHATVKALTEAVRSHRGCRQWLGAGGVWDMTTPVEAIGHRERLYYWAVPENAKHLEFLIRGKEQSYEENPWDKDTEEGHLARILEWCASKNIECVSVPLSSSKKNVTDWHITMIVMPELQPTYLTEATRTFGGTRWKEVPQLFGYKALKTPFAERPHPFS